MDEPKAPLTDAERQKIQSAAAVVRWIVEAIIPTSRVSDEGKEEWRTDSLSDVAQWCRRHPERVNLSSEEVISILEPRLHHYKSSAATARIALGESVKKWILAAPSEIQVAAVRALLTDQAVFDAVAGMPELSPEYAARNPKRAVIQARQRLEDAARRLEDAVLNLTDQECQDIRTSVDPATGGAVPSAFRAALWKAFQRVGP